VTPSIDGPAADPTDRPQRIQLRRTKGWRKPEGAIVVARPSRWGNPYVVGTGEIQWSGSCHGNVGEYDPSVELLADLPLGGALTAEQAVRLYRDEFLETLSEIDHPNDPDRERALEIAAALEELRGRDLACWCPLDQPCHADVLLEVANA
jgi:hypothetical protein